MLYLRMMLTESDMTRCFLGTWIDFMEPMITQLSWGNLFGTWFTGFPVFQVSKESHFLAGQENGIFWRPWKERNLPKFIGTKVKSGGEVLDLASQTQGF